MVFFLILFGIHFSLFTITGSAYLLRFPFLLVLFGGLPFYYGPLFFFYLRSFLLRETTWPKRDLLHFLPGIADLLFYLVMYLTRGRQYFVIGIEGAFRGNPYWFVPMMDALKTVSGFAYAVAAVIMLRRHRRLLKKWAEYRIHNRWIKTLIISFIAA